MPRKPLIADATQSVYVEAVRDFLKARGVADPKVQITRILRVDLDGDSEEEVLISATNYFTEDKSVSVEPLLSYKLNPFTIFYVGSSHALDEGPAGKNFSERSRQFFAKLQYLVGV